MDPDQCKLGLLTEEFGAYSTEFVRRQLDALGEFHPFVGCLKRVNADVFKYEPVYEFSSSGMGARIMDGLLRALPRRLRYTDAAGAQPVLRRLLKKYRPKALHVHFGWMAARVADVLVSSRIPYTVVIHGSDINLAMERPGAVYARRLLRAMASAEKVLFVSEHLYEKGVALGCPKDRAEVFYLGVPVSGALAKPGVGEGVKLVCTGRFVPVKGHEWLLRTFAEVLEHHNEATLCLIGTGELREEMIRLAGELGISDSVRFRENLLSSEVREELLNSHIYVQSSIVTETGRTEGLGIAVQEAMSLGLPVVGSQCGGIPESIVHEETGLLVECGDTRGLADSLCRLAENPAERIRFGKAGYERVLEKFDQGKRNAALVELVRSMIEKNVE